MNTKVGSSTKNLEEMMLEYLDLTKSGRAHTFPKSFKKNKVPTGKKEPPITSNSTPNSNATFLKSQSGFPQWCMTDSQIPKMYRMIESCVMKNGILDTTLLYPILLSSGLHRHVLGHIWFLVNQSTPGQLLPHELYAALALIAIAQNGCQFNNLDVLHNLCSPPIPFLQHPSWNFQAVGASPTLQHLQTNPGIQPSIPAPLSSETTEVFAPRQDERQDQFSHFVAAPSETHASKPKANQLSLGNSAVGSRLANYSGAPPAKGFYPAPAYSTGEIAESTDDEFADFQQAKPVEGNTLVQTDITSRAETFLPGLRGPKDSVKEAKQRIEADDGGSLPSFNNPPATKPLDQAAQPKVPLPTSTISQPTSTAPEEDKYSVFRELDQERHQKNNNEEEFGDFLTCVEPTEVSLLDAATASLPKDILHHPMNDLLTGWNSPEQKKKEWIQPASQGSPEAVVHPLQSLETKNDLQTSIQCTLAEIEDEFEGFGEFVGPGQLKEADNLSQLGIPDNLSVENQSISSLELSPLEAIVFSGESVNDLACNASLRSLDLKLGSENEENNGTSTLEKRMDQEFATASQKSNNDASEMINRNFFSLIDRYSSVSTERETRSESERNVHEWEKCLENCYQLIEGVYRNFSEISSLAVCKEVINSTDGDNYIKNVIEMYKLVSRIRLSARSSALENSSIKQLLQDVDIAWQNASKFISMSSSMPNEEHFNYTEAILKPEPENNDNACGVCLLNVNARLSCSTQDTYKLTYGGRQYHSTCANFWVNCVNSLLPALTLQQLL